MTKPEPEDYVQTQVKYRLLKLERVMNGYRVEARKSFSDPVADEFVFESVDSFYAWCFGRLEGGDE